MLGFAVSKKSKFLVIWLLTAGDMAIASEVEIASEVPRATNFQINGIFRDQSNKQRNLAFINIHNLQENNEDPSSKIDGLNPRLNFEKLLTQRIRLPVLFRDQSTISNKSHEKIEVSDISLFDNSSDFQLIALEKACMRFKIFCLEKQREVTLNLLAQRKIVINLTYNQLSYFENGILIDKWNVGTGRPGRSTPTGLFYIREKEICPPYFGSRGDHNNPGCTPENPFGPRILWFIGHLYGIHGTNQESLIAPGTTAASRRVSGGCIRNPNEKILWLFTRVKVGDPIEITR